MSEYRKGIGEARAYRMFSPSPSPEPSNADLYQIRLRDEHWQIEYRAAHGDTPFVPRTGSETSTACHDRHVLLRDLGDAHKTILILVEGAARDHAALAEAEHEIHRLEDALGAMGMHVSGMHEAPSQYDGLSARPCTIAACIAERVAQIAEPAS